MSPRRAGTAAAASPADRDLTATIEIDADPVEKITVKLVGQLYRITPPKASLAIKLGVQAKTIAKEDPIQVINVLDEWIFKAFGKAEGKKVKARLDDGQDDLDITHIMALMEKIVEASTGDPTS